MTEEDMVHLGMYAEGLMRQDEFNVLTAQFEQNKFQDWASTQPHEAKKRDGIYAQTQGLREFLFHLKAYVDQKNQIIERDNALSEEDAQEEIID